ncbi:hypothetical protein DCAR_0830419 [Daucus carota subsp. sativus]|uniref:Uncharacterized protein n=1 Tax=Daucus carota subsp. sativus TaxID=79200 RepID=A0A175YJG5_DAUCS|nr:hypothetical protein DCAR_0830419 [Daucus carota subsp. sativus]
MFSAPLSSPGHSQIISPAATQGAGEVSDSSYRLYGLHGEIMMVVVLSIFGLFIASLLVYLYVKRESNRGSKERDLEV